MLAWLSLNMGLSHELIQNERGCLIYEASPRFVFGRLYGVESSSERVSAVVGRLFAWAFSNIRVEHFDYSRGHFRIFVWSISNIRLGAFEWRLWRLAIV